MDLSSSKTIKELLAKYETKPSKGMGQNFLVNKSVLKKITESADLKSKDTVLEIGPGIGTLTAELANVVKKVIAVEKDRYMCQILKETLKDYKNIKIINDDILKIENYKIKNYKVVANIPYYLTSPLIRKFLETKYPPEFMMLMVQKEVAQRICANPPSPPTNFVEHETHKKIKKTHDPKLVGGKMSILAVSVQFYATAKIISYVKKENFWPKPKIDSAIIKITPHKNIPPLSAELFFKIVKAGFSQPRKQLGNNLAKILKLDKQKINLWLSKNKIEPAQRAETLSVDDWINLT
ncbi:MAG: 16S rRNA (adenine(1518)-N(6)/adenine(1519)-N(6))-dimethyltransferase [Candidatus Staskawiczbacteria bacterium]|nr:16S rRNA (adenine(1518)-N(6)/adenine(1519)-N(6))-dimethyltransferase [Candidatus Staskawiczbacteria bacterium]